MVSKRELEKAIAECERGDQDFASCQKLATLYEVHDHLYGDNSPTVKTEIETVIDDYGDTEFLTTIRGADAEHVFMVMDELMSTLQLINPRLYAGVMRKMSE